MEQRVSVITLGVSDLARARNFYVDGLGWEPVAELDEVVFFQLNGIVLGLFGLADLLEDAQLPADDPAGRVGGTALGYNVRERDEVDPVIERAKMGPVRNFVFVSHTLSQKGGRRYGEEDP